MMQTRTFLGLGKPRTVKFDDHLNDGVALPALAARQITQPELWADTSEALTVAQYQYLALKLGMKGCFRYVPLYGGGGGITATELAGALSVKCPDGSPFSIGFVQFARSNNIGAATGAQDGAAMASYLKSLTIPSSVSCFQDLDVNASVANCTAYTNDSFSAATAGGMEATAPGMYAEPGYPLSASQRYALYVHRYWATAANDPNKWVASRGCQVIQLWGSARGEYFPEAGLVIDGDVVQYDYFNSAPVVVTAAV